MPMPFDKYTPYTTVDLPDRTWPNVVLTSAPIWCSTDLRDGNQALVNPMDPHRKRRFFALLLELGFEEIEVGFPAASKADFDFVRTLIEEDIIPDGVTIAVLTQARPELIERTFESIEGARSAIVHLYNSTSVTQRRVVFRLDRAGITELAVRGAEMCRSLAGDSVRFEYSPESFHHTELEFALEICEAVAGAWGPTPADPMIVNLPTTVEHFPPERVRRPNRVVRAALHAPRRCHPLRPPAQRPRHGGCDGGAGADGRRAARRGNAVRQRRAHGQRRHRHARAQPPHPGRRPASRSVAARRGSADRRRVQRVCRCTRAIRGRASSSTPHSPARTRTRSRRACTRSTSSPRARAGTCHTCRSIRATSAARTRRSSASTRSRGRAALRTCSRTGTGSSFRAGCRSSLRRRCRR